MKLLNEDLERLGIPKQTGEGKLDFHSLRVAYINLLFKTGSDPKTTQELTCHSDPRLTMIIYGRAETGRKQGAMEAAYELVRGRNQAVDTGSSDEEYMPPHSSGYERGAIFP